MESYYKNRRIGILGFGIEGFSSAKFLITLGAKITVLDKRPKESLETESIKEAESLGITFITGENYLSKIYEFEMLVRSPGISITTPELINAQKKGITITSQTKLFFELCPCPVIGVTGTKGKGTTATLIYNMLLSEGLDAYLGGNIGFPPLDVLSKLNPASFVVLELSSFQLQDLHRSPHIAVLLMLTSEHLDYHLDTYEYVASKRNIIRFQTQTDFAIINIDYPASRESDV